MAMIDSNTDITEVEGQLEVDTAEALVKRYDSQEYNDKTKSQIALKFVNWFFRLVILSLVIAFAYNLVILFLLKDDSKLVDVKEMILTIAGVIGGPLGFILGYYFKTQEERRDS
jgi:hypothetical protein